MKLYSTRNPKMLFDLKEAVLKGLPDDNGLFMPESIPRLPDAFFEGLEGMSFAETAYEMAHGLIGDSIGANELQRIVDTAVNFPAPLVTLSDDVHVLELFHGPSLAFKDFGARFMAQLMSYFNDSDQPLRILVATSGDTGGAVAAGFLNTPGIEVVILYPSGKVSDLQEKQLTTLGGNITALEVDGTFDDCQHLVKQAFLDKNLTSKHRLSSANSINIARVIPQMFYYVEAYKQLSDKSRPVVFSVPSGNFGNLTAGLFAKQMGLPVSQFIAATNDNDIVPKYLHSGNYEPRPSVRTLSNAMDVGAPSNFARMMDLYCSTWNIIKGEISGYAYNDEATKKGIAEVWKQFGYVIDPHGSVGYLALQDYMKEHDAVNGVVLETAHPSKFLDTVEGVIGSQVPIPERLAILKDRKKVAVDMTTKFEDFKQWLY